MSDDAKARYERRYARAAHRMQAGVAQEMTLRDQPTSPKHLRVGVNSALVDSSALANLLIKKGLITEEEFFEAIATGMEAEAAEYEARLSEMMGKPVRLDSLQYPEEDVI